MRWTTSSWLVVASTGLLSIAGAEDAAAPEKDPAATPADTAGLPTAKLSNGRSWPMIGLGGASGVRLDHVQTALKLGYRFIDTAQAYQWGYHEDEVGAAIQSSGVPRESLFIQTKIHPQDLGYEATKRAFQVSLQHLNTTYVDSLLLHKPNCWEGACKNKPEGTWQDSWRALEELYDAGQVKAIGMCDVTVELMAELLKQRHKPHFVQNWFDPFHQDKAVRNECNKVGVQYQGYTTFGFQWAHFGLQSNPVWEDASLTKLEQKYNAPRSQIVLQWALSRGVMVMPASRHPVRQRMNLESFKVFVTENDKAVIDGLDGTIQAHRPSEAAVKAKAEAMAKAEAKAKAAAKDQEDDRSFEVEFNVDAPGKLQIFYVDQTDTAHMVGTISQKDPGRLRTHHGHRFRFQRENGKVVAEYQADAGGGKRQRHVISSSEL